MQRTFLFSFSPPVLSPLVLSSLLPPSLSSISPPSPPYPLPLLHLPSLPPHLPSFPPSPPCLLSPLIPPCCRRGEVVFRSDNLSTISVLREVLSKEATQRKISVKITHGQQGVWGVGGWVGVGMDVGVSVCLCMCAHTVHIYVCVCMCICLCYSVWI